MSAIADPIDAAAETTEAFTQAAVERAKAPGPGPRLSPKGRCHNCEDPVSDPKQLFCDDDCAEDHDYVQRRKRANQKPV